MTLILKQSTTANVVVGPFVDATDGKTAETGITGLKVRLSKNGGTIAALATATDGTHDQRGYYTVSLDATDTNTVGTLVATATSSTSLPVRHEMQVVDELIYDRFYSSTATMASTIINMSNLATGGAIFEQALTESYAADGSEMTVAQALYLIQQKVGDFAISGTTISVKKLDGSTEAATYTLDSASAPTSSTRAT